MSFVTLSTLAAGPRLREYRRPMADGSEPKIRNGAKAPRDPAEQKLRDATLRDPGVLQTIGKAIRACIPAMHVEDVAQEALIAIDAADALPDDRDTLLRYVYGIARNKAADWLRKNNRQVKVVDGEDAEGGEELAPAQVVSPVENQDAVKKLLESVPRHQLSTFQLVVRHYVHQETLADLARETGVDYSVLHKRLRAMLGTLAATATVLGIAIFVGVMFPGAFARMWGSEPPIAKEPPVTLPTSAPAVSTSEPQPDALQQARESRAAAFLECSHDEWEKCALDLNAASSLDPAGDRDPLVQAAREDVGTAFSAKPGWRPTPREKRIYTPKGSK
jgi:RNA polymerase sigma factor (sigma-70 family)